KGLTSFYPDSIPKNKNIPAIVLTDFRIFNKEVKLDTSITEKKVITISYKENFFSFDFASLDYTNSVKNQHAYMLEGVDQNWINVGNVRTANYTDIEPGEYIFRVKGSNNDGLWNEEGTSVKLTITPPWWQTWWFKSCGAILIFMTAGYGYKKRVSKLKKEKSAQEEFSKKLLNSQEEERKKIASVLHDSIAHDVLITKNSSEIGLRSAGENEEVKEILNKISEQSSSTLNELRRIQFNLHPYEVEKLGLTKAIKSIVDRSSKSTEIEFIIEEDFIDKIFSEENEIHLYRIIQEAVNNIIKHSSATDSSIKILRTDENLFITISDNGKGFVKSNALRKNSMGLSGISERVRLLGGTLEINSEGSGGTTLRIILPYKN
ncbi:MAG: triple tyrosine motif-containing protein, partial [Ignavibacteria bacterium]